MSRLEIFSSEPIHFSHFGEAFCIQVLHFGHFGGEIYWRRILILRQNILAISGENMAAKDF